MSTKCRLSSCVLSGVAWFGLSLLSGCGDDSGLGKRYAVSGTVTYLGNPVAKGQITFTPVKVDDSIRPANGFIEGGSYTLTTSAPSDGAMPGEYKVTITSKEVDDSKIKATIAEKGGGARQQDVAKATGNAKNLVPAKYQLADTSGLTATVKEQSNKIDFDLKD